MIVLTPAPLAALCRHTAEAFPEECCGVLGGSHVEGRKRVEAVVPLPNASTDSPQNRYFAPAASIRLAERELEARGFDVIGFYHSHPNAQSHPSSYDLAQATWPVYSYIIVSARDGKAEEVTSWVLSEDRKRFTPERIEIDRTSIESAVPAAEFTYGGGDE